MSKRFKQIEKNGQDKARKIAELINSKVSARSEPVNGRLEITMANRHHLALPANKKYRIRSAQWMANTFLSAMPKSVERFVNLPVPEGVSDSGVEVVGNVSVRYFSFYDPGFDVQRYNYAVCFDS